MQKILLIGVLAAFFGPSFAFGATVTLTSGSSWTVPADWSNVNTIEVVGGGGAGHAGNTSWASCPGWCFPNLDVGSGGGGGGAYAKITNFSATPGAAITISVGTGGMSTSGGGDTYFSGSACASASICAKGGASATNNIGAAGGSAASSVGTVKYSGGNGGTAQYGAAGGGGAGGASGSGGEGGSGGGGAGGGGGSGGAGGGGGTGGSGISMNSNAGAGGGGGGGSLGVGKNGGQSNGGAGGGGGSGSTNGGDGSRGSFSFGTSGAGGSVGGGSGLASYWGALTGGSGSYGGGGGARVAYDWGTYTDPYNATGGASSNGGGGGGGWTVGSGATAVGGNGTRGGGGGAFAFANTYTTGGYAVGGSGLYGGGGGGAVGSLGFTKGAGGTGIIIITYTSAAPTCSITATPNAINYGSASTLSWTSTNATTFYISSVGYVNSPGSTSVSPAVTTTYTGTVTGAGGTGTCSRTVTVTPPATPTLTLTASPGTVAYNNVSALSWSSSSGYIDDCKITGGIWGSGTNVTVPQSNVTTGPLAADTTYTFSCNFSYNGTSLTNAVRTVTVGPMCSMSANPTSVTPGGYSSLSWTSQNATGGAISPTVGAVAPSGSGSVQPLTTTAYNGTFTGPGGSAQCSVQVALTCAPLYSCSGNTVTYTNTACTTSNVATCAAPSFCSAGEPACVWPPAEFVPQGTLTGHLQARPAVILEGSTTRLYWSVDDVTSCSVTGGGQTWNGRTSPAGGALTNAIFEKTIYRLNCVAYQGQPNIAESIDVVVTPRFQER